MSSREHTRDGMDYHRSGPAARVDPGHDVSPAQWTGAVDCRYSPSPSNGSTGAMRSTGCASRRAMPWTYRKNNRPIRVSERVCRAGRSTNERGSVVSWAVSRPVSCDHLPNRSLNRRSHAKPPGLPEHLSPSRRTRGGTRGGRGTAHRARALRRRRGGAERHRPRHGAALAACTCRDRLPRRGLALSHPRAHERPVPNREPRNPQPRRPHQQDPDRTQPGLRRAAGVLRPRAARAPHREDARARPARRHAPEPGAGGRRSRIAPRPARGSTPATIARRSTPPPPAGASTGRRSCPATARTQSPASAKSGSESPPRPCGRSCSTRSGSRASFPGASRSLRRTATATKAT